jgi:hypothetical protein
VVTNKDWSSGVEQLPEWLTVTNEHADVSKKDWWVMQVAMLYAVAHLSEINAELEVDFPDDEPLTREDFDAMVERLSLPLRPRR